MLESGIQLTQFENQLDLLVQAVAKPEFGAGTIAQATHGSERHSSPECQAVLAESPPAPRGPLLW